jgi:hypothetical protein
VDRCSALYTNSQQLVGLCSALCQSQAFQVPCSLILIIWPCVPKAAAIMNERTATMEARTYSVLARQHLTEFRQYLVFHSANFAGLSALRCYSSTVNNCFWIDQSLQVRNLHPEKPSLCSLRGNWQSFLPTCMTSCYAGRAAGTKSGKMVRPSFVIYVLLLILGFTIDSLNFICTCQFLSEKAASKTGTCFITALDFP